MCLGHWYTPGTKGLRSCWSGDPMEEERGRPTKRDDKLKNQMMNVMCEDRRLTVRELCEMLGIGKSTVQRILSDLSISRKCAL